MSCEIEGKIAKCENIAEYICLGCYQRILCNEHYRYHLKECKSLKFVQVGCVSNEFFNDTEILKTIINTILDSEKIDSFQTILIYNKKRTIDKYKDGKNSIYSYEWISTIIDLYIDYIYYLQKETNHNPDSSANLERLISYCEEAIEVNKFAMGRFNEINVYIDLFYKLIEVYEHIIKILNNLSLKDEILDILKNKLEYYQEFTLDSDKERYFLEEEKIYIYSEVKVEILRSYNSFLELELERSGEKTPSFDPPVFWQYVSEIKSKYFDLSFDYRIIALNMYNAYKIRKSNIQYDKEREDWIDIIYGILYKLVDIKFADYDKYMEINIELGYLYRDTRQWVQLFQVFSECIIIIKEIGEQEIGAVIHDHKDKIKQLNSFLQLCMLHKDEICLYSKELYDDLILYDDKGEPDLADEVNSLGQTTVQLGESQNRVTLDETQFMTAYASIVSNSSNKCRQSSILSAHKLKKNLGSFQFSRSALDDYKDTNHTSSFKSCKQTQEPATRPEDISERSDADESSTNSLLEEHHKTRSYSMTVAEIDQFFYQDLYCTWNYKLGNALLNDESYQQEERLYALSIFKKRKTPKQTKNNVDIYSILSQNNYFESKLNNYRNITEELISRVESIRDWNVIDKVDCNQFYVEEEVQNILQKKERPFEKELVHEKQYQKYRQEASWVQKYLCCLNPKRLVSKQKRRYISNEVDLDLCYITERVIAMGYPASGFETLYRNDRDELDTFFNSTIGKNEYIGENYKIYNLCIEQDRQYEIKKYSIDKIANYMFLDHKPCSIRLLLKFCIDISEYLTKNYENVALIHCKAGKGRTGVMSICYLLFSGLIEDKLEDERLHQYMEILEEIKIDTKTKRDAYSRADLYYSYMRTFNNKGVRRVSQIRYLRYFYYFLKIVYNEPFFKSAIYNKKITNEILDNKEARIAKHLVTYRLDSKNNKDEVKDFDSENSTLVNTQCKLALRTLSIGPINLAQEALEDLVFDAKVAPKALRHSCKSHLRLCRFKSYKDMNEKVERYYYFKEVDAQNSTTYQEATDEKMRSCNRDVQFVGETAYHQLNVKVVSKVVRPRASKGACLKGAKAAEKQSFLLVYFEEALQVDNHDPSNNDFCFSLHLKDFLKQELWLNNDFILMYVPSNATQRMYRRDFTKNHADLQYSHLDSLQEPRDYEDRDEPKLNDIIALPFALNEDIEGKVYIPDAIDERYEMVFYYHVIYEEYSDQIQYMKYNDN